MTIQSQRWCAGSVSLVLSVEAESRGKAHVIILLAVSTELPRSFVLHWKTAF